MSARKPRWEVVRSAAGFHARFRSSNGAILVSSEVYRDRRDAVRCIAVVGDAPRYSDGKDADLIEVRDVDDLSKPPKLDDARALAQWARRQSVIAREIKADRKIHAIKELRSLTGASLFQSKNAMDIVWAEREVTR